MKSASHKNMSKKEKKNDTVWLHLDSLVDVTSSRLIKSLVSRKNKAESAFSGQVVRER